MGGKTVIVFWKRETLLEYGLLLWKRVYDESLALQGRMTAALSGGHSPVDFYRALSAVDGDLDWRRIHIFLVDERFVRADDRDSNYRMIRETLLDGLAIPAGNIHAPGTGLHTAEVAARIYENDLEDHFGLRPGELPRFDLMVLGIGEDGHTASIFPESPALAETCRLVVVVERDPALHDRVSLTLPVINRGRHIVFLALGAAKAAVLKRVLEGPDPSLPASLVDPGEGDIFFLADREAGSLLSRESYVSGEM